MTHKRETFRFMERFIDLPDDYRPLYPLGRKRNKGSKKDKYRIFRIALLMIRWNEIIEQYTGVENTIRLEDFDYEIFCRKFYDSDESFTKCVEDRREPGSDNHRIHETLTHEEIIEALNDSSLVTEYEMLHEKYQYQFDC